MPGGCASPPFPSAATPAQASAANLGATARARRVMADTLVTASAPSESKGGRDVGFAIAIATLLSILSLPIPPAVIDIGLALSIALSVLILMVSLWIQKPLDFSAFPT